MGESVADLTGTSWRDDIWLQCYGIHPANALEYFALSPFYDPASNNEIARLKHLRVEKLTNAPGIEYVLQDAQPPHLFVIRRYLRASPSSETAQAYYYILDGTIYQAPSLHSVFHTRLQRCRYSFQSAFQEIQHDLHPLDADVALDSSLQAEIDSLSDSIRPDPDREQIARVDANIRVALSSFPMPTIQIAPRG